MRAATGNDPQVNGHGCGPTELHVYTSQFEFCIMMPLFRLKNILNDNVQFYCVGLTKTGGRPDLVLGYSFFSLSV